MPISGIEDNKGDNAQGCIEYLPDVYQTPNAEASTASLLKEADEKPTLGRTSSEVVATPLLNVK